MTLHLPARRLPWLGADLDWLLHPRVAVLPWQGHDRFVFVFVFVAVGWAVLLSSSCFKYTAAWLLRRGGAVDPLPRADSAARAHTGRLPWKVEVAKRGAGPLPSQGSCHWVPKAGLGPVRALAVERLDAVVHQEERVLVRCAAQTPRHASGSPGSSGLLGRDGRALSPPSHNTVECEPRQCY